MRSLVPKLLAVSLVSLAALVCAPGALAAPTFSTFFKLTANEALNTNNKIVAGPDGNIWFTVQTTGKEVARITPLGVITEFALPEAENATGIAVGPEGKIWLTAVEKAIRFSPANPEGTEEHFTVPGIGAEGQIVLGSNGEMWVASNNQITHFSPSDPEGKNGTFTPVGALTPKDIAVAGSGLVVADANHGRLLTIAANGTQGADIPLGGGTTTAQGVAGNTNGQIAFSKSDTPEGLGLVTPPAAPTAVLMAGDPFGVTLGGDGNYWFAMSAAHGLEPLTPTGQAAALPFPGLEKWFPRQLAAGPGGTLWVTMEVPGGNEYAIAKVVGVEPPLPPPPPPVVVTAKPVPQTSFGKRPKKVVRTSGKKATVRFTFSSSVAGSTFQCRLSRIPAGKKKKAKASRVAFSSCRSPRVLKLGVGKYSFAVRAVAAGVPDASPSQYGFRVVRPARHHR
jgi:virginiamycin B lyase